MANSDCLAMNDQTADPVSAALSLESHLLGQAMWCGIVFSLAALLTALNLVPPVSVRYTVASNIVVSPPRLESLQVLAREHKRRSKEQPSNEALIRGIKVLDRTTEDHVSAAGLGKQELILVEIESTWTQGCTEAGYAAWLDSLPLAQVGRQTETVAAKELRLARWELAVAKHYASHHELHSIGTRNSVKSSPPQQRRSAANGPVTERRVSASLASHNAGMTGSSPPAVGSGFEAEIQAAQRKLAETELAWQQQIEQSSGALRITGRPAVAPEPGFIPFWMAVSVLILGVASGSTAGWVQHRLQSGGAHEPLLVAEQLELQGVPLAGRLDLASNSAGHSDWVGITSRQASCASRQTARNLTRISEYMLGFWCSLILVRILVDPLWRMVLIESPLAAFGRLLAGMP